MQLPEFRPNNDRRPADWRWLWAKYLVDNNMRLTRARSDDHILAARDFARDLMRVTDESDHLRLSDEAGDLYEAWAIYQETQIRANVRWEIEARVLARQPLAEISKSVSTRESILQVYCDVFFDVMPRISQEGWITHVVISDSLNRQVDKNPEGYWKLFGYWGGKHVLDCLIYRFNRPVKPESPKSVPGFMSDDIRSTMQTKAMLAIRTMPVNWQTQIEIMNLYYRMLELENNTDAIGSGGTESFKASISSFMNSIPWTRDNKLKTEIGIIDAIDSGAVSLRSDELMIAGVGGTVPTQHLNIAYPEPNTKPAGG